MNKRIETLGEILLEMANFITVKQMINVAIELKVDYTTLSAYLQGQIQDKDFAEKVVTALKKQVRSAHETHVEAYAEILGLISDILKQLTSCIAKSKKLVKTMNSKLQQLDDRLSTLQESNISSSGK